jgi:hypothetical protein
MANHFSYAATWSPDVTANSIPYLARSLPCLSTFLAPAAAPKPYGPQHHDHMTIQPVTTATKPAVLHVANLLATTDTNLKAITTPAIIGSSRKPLTTTTTSAVLHRRANFRPIRAVNTAVPLLGAQHFPTTLCNHKNIGKRR